MTEEDMIVAARLAAYYDIDPAMTLAEIHQAMNGTAIWKTCALEVRTERIEEQLLDALGPLGSHFRRLLSAVARAYWRAVKRELDRDAGR